MKALDLLATEENIYTTFIDDAIGRDADVFSFVSFLNSLDSGNVIALNARWGEGKVYVVPMTQIGTGNLDISKALIYDGFGKILDVTTIGY